MTSTSETGHAKNVANFAEIISFCTGYGASYNPSKNTIKLTNLTPLLDAAQSAINEVNLSNTAYNNAVNNRLIAFKSLKPLSTRIINALEATDASIEVVKDAKTINRKIQGQRAKKIEEPTDPNTPAPNTISVSQQSYDQRIQHLSRLLILLQSEASYTPNENDLKTTTLNAFLDDLNTKNQDVTDKYTSISNARIARNQVLYGTNVGLFDVASDIKNYIKSLFGPSSPQYKQISAIKFTALKK